MDNDSSFLGFGDSGFNEMRLTLELLELVVLYFMVFAVVIGVPLGLFWFL